MSEHWLNLMVVSGVEGPSIYLDDFRIAGAKPWGGGNVLYEFKVSAEEIAGVLAKVPMQQYKAWSALSGTICSDCPPIKYHTDKTRCTECPRRKP